MKYNIKCPAVQAAYVDSRNPNTHYSGADQIIASYSRTAFVKFDLSPLASYKKKNLTNVQLCFYNSSTRAGVDVFVTPVNSPIDYNTITFNTAPSVDQAYEIEFYNSDYRVNPAYGVDYLKRGNVKLEEQSGLLKAIDFLNSSGNFSIYSDGYDSPADSYENSPLIMNGTNAGNLYLEVYFEDLDSLFSHPYLPENYSFVNPLISNTFKGQLDANVYFLSPVAINSVSLFLNNLTDSIQKTVTIPQQNNTLKNYTFEFSVPANTLESGKKYSWRVAVNTESGFINYDDGHLHYHNYLTTVDVTPSAPQIISPQSMYLDGEQPVILQWKHNISTGSLQYAYDLDYLQTGDWTNLVNHAVSSAQTYTIPANTLAAGNFQWRVRTYNTSNVAGPYATSGRSIVKIPPQPPVIRAINAAPRLSVSWQATGQNAFNVTITDASGNTVINSGNVYGVQKEYEIGTYLPDGSYTVSVKIQNAQGEWSNAVTSGANIQNNPVGVDEIQATPIRNGVSLRTGPPPADYGAYVGETVLQSPGKYLTDKIGTTETTPEGTHYILRDGEPIAKLDGNSFIDYTSVGPHEYRLRVTYADGTYYDSLPVTAAPILPYATIAFLDDPGTLFVLKYQRDARPTTEKQISETLVSHAFLGRDLPVYDATGQKSIQWDFAYTLLHNLDGAAPFFAQQKTVIVRDPKGERAIGLIQSHNLTFRRQFRELTFSVAGNDATEVIPYD